MTPRRESLDARVRRRLKQEAARQEIAQREIARRLNWSQTRVATKLNARTPLTLVEVEALCHALNYPLADLFGKDEP